ELLVRVRPMDGFVSPRLGIRFELSGPELVVRYPDGRPFLTFEELAAQHDQAEQRAERAEQRAARIAALALNVSRQQATPGQVQELQRLIQGVPAVSNTSGAGQG